MGIELSWEESANEQNFFWISFQWCNYCSTKIHVTFSLLSVKFIFNIDITHIYIYICNQYSFNILVFIQIKISNINCVIENLLKVIKLNYNCKLLQYSQQCVRCSLHAVSLILSTFIRSNRSLVIIYICLGSMVH